MKKILFIFLSIVSFVSLGLSTNAYSYYNEFGEYEIDITSSIIDIYPVQKSTNFPSYSVGDEFYNPSLGVTYRIEEVQTPRGNSVIVFRALNEMNSNLINQINYEFDMSFPNASRISTASAKYNCHSFAWYRQDTSNPFWMNDPSEYYNDNSYVESTGRIGDIICYYDRNGTNIHSGVVISRLQGPSNNVCGDSDLVTVESKWGAAGLYQHRGDQCPYTNPYGGVASYVKYFTRRPTHNHHYTIYDNY